MPLDVAALRARFPSLASGIAHFDGPGGTQTPREVGEAIAATITGPLSNRGRQTASAVAADDAVTAFRQAYADLLGVPATGIVHGRSATQLTFDLARALARTWGPGDEVVVSRLDHDANVRPWILAAESVGARVRWIDFDPETAEVDVDAAIAVLGERTRLVAITGASNVLGTMPDVAAIAAAAHAVGALVHVDAVHLAAHALVDVRALGADLLVCSPYKLLGPHCGVLAADPTLLERIHPDKLVPSSDAVPERFELGTLPYELLAGATAAVDVLASLAPTRHERRRDRLRDAFDAIHAHETALRERIERVLADHGDAVVLHSRARDRTPTLLVTLPGRSTARAAQHLADLSIAAPSGSFYALEPFRRLALPGDEALRIGLAPYVDDADVDRLLDGLEGFLRSTPARD